ncbi:unnamed protein product [Angiostrongylus costaricensis]|uniref:Transposase n=1 Tax=Angiostrongylus costaricensis TaxID=334426 RepID=A0A0R3Q205_ANGCS|nr:unnamed protein product [Angiostrongylus costaricensis]
MLRLGTAPNSQSLRMRWVSDNYRDYRDGLAAGHKVAQMELREKYRRELEACNPVQSANVPDMILTAHGSLGALIRYNYDSLECLERNINQLLDKLPVIEIALKTVSYSFIF